MIKPTPGRVVWFHSNGAHPAIVHRDLTQPLAATIAYVWSDTMVSLSMIDQNGVPHPVTSVRLLQDDETPPVGNYAEWIPAQKEQQAKLDALAGSAPSAAA